MADKAGCLFGLLVNGAPVEIKVNPDFEFDPEIKENRAIVSGATTRCTPRTVTTSYGGIIRTTGFLDPANSGCALILAASVGGSDLTGVKYVIDMSASAGSRSGFNCGDCKLIPRRFTGVTDEGGMQKWEIEIHTQAGHTYATNL